MPPTTDPRNARHQELRGVIDVMGQKLGKDLSVFDEQFLANSIEKRLEATGIQTIAIYLQYLLQTAEEAETLYASLTITYSEFFRDPQNFAMLERMILPSLLQKTNMGGRREIRVWSAASAAGQEAYSVAILLNELAESHAKSIAFRIFATDISKTELDKARNGIYSVTEVRRVRLAHLGKYLVQRGEAYETVSKLKGQVDFSVYDLLDRSSACPAASIYGDFDLVLCCNLLFYYQPEIRQFLLSKLYRCLSPGGFLVTGQAERDLVGRCEGLKTITPLPSVFQKS